MPTPSLKRSTCLLQQQCKRDTTYTIPVAPPQFLGERNLGSSLYHKWCLLLDRKNRGKETSSQRRLLRTYYALATSFSGSLISLFLRATEEAINKTLL